MLVRCIEDRVVHAVQTPDHVHALIQVGIDPAAMPQHDDALRLVLEQHGDDAMPTIRQISAGTDQQLAFVERGSGPGLVPCSPFRTPGSHSDGR